MGKYFVYWSKTYHATGDVIIEAESRDEARRKALDNIGDYEGSMQYDPDGDRVYSVARVEEERAST